MPVRACSKRDSRRRSPFNPYWNLRGGTFIDPDGYCVVLAHDRWPGAVGPVDSVQKGRARPRGKSEILRHENRFRSGGFMSRGRIPPYAVRLASRGAMVVACAMLTAASADDLTGRELVSATLWMQRAPEYRAITEQVYRLATEKLAAPAPGSAARRAAGPRAGSAGAHAHGRGARPRRDRARQHRLPGALAARSRELRLAAAGVSGSPRPRPRPSRARASSSPRRAGSGTRFSTSPTAIAPRRRRRADGSVPGEDRDHAQPGGARHRSARPIRSTCCCAANARNGIAAARPSGARSSRLTTASWRWWATISATSSIRGSSPPTANASNRGSASSWFLLPNPIYGSWINPYDTARGEIRRRCAPRMRCWNCRAAVSGMTAPARCASRSWNVEYLMTPATHLALRDHCAENGGMVGGDDRTLPCAITRREPRSAGRLRFAAQLRRASSRPTSSRCRKSTDRTPPRRSSRATTTASARARIRRRMALPSAAGCRIAARTSTSRCRSTTRCAAAWWSPSFRAPANEFRLMSVHLKSGCPEGPLTAEGRNCELLSQQVAPLKALDRSRGARRPPLRRARRFQPPLHAREGSAARRRRAGC